MNFAVFLRSFCFMLLLTTAGCATVGGARQPIAFDTNPRGLDLVINQNLSDESIRTPAALEVKRSSKLRLDYSSGDFSKVFNVSCHFRYGTVLLGNLGLAVLSSFVASPTGAGILFLTGTGIDLVSGSAFECPSLISNEVAVTEAVAQELREGCRPVFILPPKLSEDDVGISYALVSEAQEFIKRYDQSCRSFVTPSVTKAAMSRSSFSGSSFKELFEKESERKLAQILRDTRARRGVDLRIVRQTASQTEIEFKLWDLYTQKEISSFRKNFSRQKFEGLKSGWFMQTVGKSIRLLPNSFALLSSNQNLAIESEFSVKEEIIRRKGFINLLSVTSVQHPDQFDVWDIGFEAGPSLVVNAFNSRVIADTSKQEVVDFIKANPDAGLSSDFTGYAFALPFDTSVSFHTPAGAFRGFLGTGLGLYLPTSNQAPNQNLKAFPLVHVGVDWVAYSSHRFFTQMGVHSYAGGFGTNSIEKRKYLNFSRWSSFTFGFGYYFPDTQGYLESLLVRR